MSSECRKIADQLRRAFHGEAWHGPSLEELLKGVTAEQACSRVLTQAHTIWELVLHIDVWVKAGFEAVHGTPMPIELGSEQDWPSVADPSSAAWSQAVERLFQTAERMKQTIEEFPPERLREIVPGRPYNFYFLFHGIVQHSLYHGGQIAMLKRAV